MWCRARDSAEKLIDGADGEQSLSLATDRFERILTLIKSQNVAIYKKKQPGRKPAPFTQGSQV